jgi:hypothetical protein
LLPTVMRKKPLVALEELERALDVSVKLFRRRGVGGWMEWGDARDGDAAVAGARGDDARTPDTNINAVNRLRQ